MALASTDDIAALGGVPVNFVPGTAEHTRAERLLELASGLVLSYLDSFGVSESDVDGWEQFRRDALAAIVAEVAVKRLNVSAAPNVDPYTGAISGPLTIKLNRWEQDAIRDLLPGNAGGSVSIEVTRDYSWISGTIEGDE